MYPRLNLRRAPTFKGLLGRKRIFMSGQSLIADEAYIRRSIEDHGSTEEYVRGFEDSVYWNHPNERERDYTRKRELRRWAFSMGKEFLSPEEVDAVLMHVMAIARRPLPYGRLTYELAGGEVGGGHRLRQEIEARLESVEQCYRLELGLYPHTAGSLTLRLKRLRSADAPEDVVLEDSLQDPDVAKCALDAVDDIVHATSLYERVPQGAKLVLHFANK